MSLIECLRFANENPICNVATIDGDMPRTRVFSMWRADKTGFYFHSDADKSVSKQLRSNPKIEVCFYSPAEPPAVGETMRVSGEIEVVDDIAVRTKLLEDRPFLRMLGVSGVDDPALFVFKIAHGDAFIWTIDNNRKETEIERIKF